MNKSSFTINAKGFTQTKNKKTCFSKLRFSDIRLLECRFLVVTPGLRPLHGCGSGKNKYIAVVYALQ